MPALFASVAFTAGIVEVATITGNNWTLGIEPENFADPSLTTMDTLRGAVPQILSGGQTIRAASGPEAGDVTNLGTPVPGVSSAFGGPAGPLNDCNMTVSYDGDLGLVDGSIMGRWKGIPVIVWIVVIVP